MLSENSFLWFLTDAAGLRVIGKSTSVSQLPGPSTSEKLHLLSELWDFDPDEVRIVGASRKLGFFEGVSTGISVW